MDKINVNFPENRMRHCYSVGRVMYTVAKQYYKWDENKAREMFLLGILHDQCYEFASEDEKHADIAANLLRNNGYKYWREVQEHNAYQDEYSSKEMDLLYLADMVVDAKGNICGFDDRVVDIENRYGKESKEAKASKKLVDYLSKKFR